MAEIKIRRLDANVLRVLKARARAGGISLEEEVRRTLSETIAASHEALARRAAACRAASKPPPGVKPLDSTDIIREERDASG
jgi:plasmid stability protein